MEWSQWWQYWWGRDDTDIGIWWHWHWDLCSDYGEGEGLQDVDKKMVSWRDHGCWCCFRSFGLVMKERERWWGIRIDPKNDIDVACRPFNIRLEFLKIFTSADYIVITSITQCWKKIWTIYAQKIFSGKLLPTLVQLSPSPRLSPRSLSHGLTLGPWCCDGLHFRHRP